MLQVQITEHATDGREITRYYDRKYRTMRGVKKDLEQFQRVYHEPRYTLAIIGEPEQRRPRDNSAAIGQVHVGDIFHCMWGYDMTFNDFYEVVAVSATGKTVTTRRIAVRMDGDPCSPARARIRPVLTGDRFIGEPERHLLQAYNNSIYIHINSFSDAFLMEPEDYVRTYDENHLD